MRLRYVSVTYSFGGSSPSLERHYRELREAMLHPAQHYAGLQPAAWRPPLDIHETEEALIVKAELAGMREDAMDIALYDNALVITGQRDDDSNHAGIAYYHEAQVRYGPFRAEIVLPTRIEPERAEANYENGFLRVRLPKAARMEGAGEPADSKHTMPRTGESGQQLASISIVSVPSSADAQTQTDSAISLAGEP
jgi:HSP20 family molecular chaperone IbpA